MSGDFYSYRTALVSKLEAMAGEGSMIHCLDWMDIQKALLQAAAELQQCGPNDRQDAERYRWLRTHWDDYTGHASRDPATWLDNTLDESIAAATGKVRT